MKKSILKLGKAINKTEQKNINGGGKPGTEVCRYSCSGVNAYAINEEACLRDGRPCFKSHAVECGGNGGGAVGYC